MTSLSKEELREAVARIIDRGAWRAMEGPWQDDSRWLSEEHRQRCLSELQSYALAKADAILALPALDAKDAEIGRLREALKPFAEASEDCDEPSHKDHMAAWETPQAMCVNIGHFRAARQALEPKP